MVHTRASLPDLVCLVDSSPHSRKLMVGKTPPKIQKQKSKKMKNKCVTSSFKRTKQARRKLSDALGFEDCGGSAPVAYSGSVPRLQTDSSPESVFADSPTTADLSGCQPPTAGNFQESPPPPVLHESPPPTWPPEYSPPPVLAATPPPATPLPSVTNDPAIAVQQDVYDVDVNVAGDDLNAVPPPPEFYNEYAEQADNFINWDANLPPHAPMNYEERGIHVRDLIQFRMFFRKVLADLGENVVNNLLHSITSPMPTVRRMFKELIHAKWLDDGEFQKFKVTPEGTIRVAVPDVELGIVRNEHNNQPMWIPTYPILDRVIWHSDLQGTEWWGNLGYLQQTF